MYLSLGELLVLFAFGGASVFFLSAIRVRELALQAVQRASTTARWPLSTRRGWPTASQITGSRGWARKRSRWRSRSGALAAAIKALVLAGLPTTSTRTSPAA